MALLSLLTKKPPTLGYGEMTLTFDAVIEDTLEASVELSDYPIEVGSISNDHRIKLPTRWTITGAISNNPLTVAVTDFTGLLTEVSDSSGVLSATAGLMAGWLSGDDATRNSEALNALLTLMYEGDPFLVDAGDVQLQNMVIESIRRTKDASNESGLIFVAELREWQEIQSYQEIDQGQTKAATGTETASASSNFIERGQQSIKDAGDSINSTVNGWFS
ncbi:putative structural protein [Vibrio phage 466E53-1]|nr:putative structural protein [Vibrio phage 466E53-1]